MSSKPLQKPRPGGGQSQSNQRQQNASDYSRSDRTNYTRQANTHHSVQTNPIAQVNMHPQAAGQQTFSAPQPVLQSQMMRTYTTHPHPQQTNPQALGNPQGIPLSQPQQGPMLNSNMMRQQFFTLPNPNQIQMRPTHRPFGNSHRNSNAGTQIPNVPSNNYICLYPNNMNFPGSYMPAVNYTVPQVLLDPFNIQRQYPAPAQPPQMNLTNSMQANEMINPGPNIYQQPQAQQQGSHPPPPPPQPAPVPKPKREKVFMKIYNEDGTEFDYFNKSNEKKTNVSNDLSQNEKIPDDIKNKPSENVITESVNGVDPVEESDEQKSDQINDQQGDDSPKLSAQQVTLEKVVEPVIKQESNSMPEQTEIVEDFVCDNNETSEKQITPEVAVEEEEEETVKEEQDNVKLITEKVANVELADVTDRSDQTPSDLVTSNNQNIESQNDNSEAISEPTISGEMEVDTPKSVDDSGIGHGSPVAEDTAKLIEVPSVSSSSEPTEETESEPNEPKLSRNSSQNGLRVYDKDFLLSLRDRATDGAISISNSMNLKEIIKKSNNVKAPTHDMFIPNFANQGRLSQNDSFRNKSQQGARRVSQTSKNYPDKSRKITSTSLHDQYGYPTSNAWKAGTSASSDPVEMETENLLKDVRATLNKLTPQNYQTLLEKFKTFKIDTSNRLIRVIDLIFDKAVKEPAFVVQYAGFCSELIHIKVTEVDAQGEQGEVKFKNLLIKKCEETFFKEMYSDIQNLPERIKEIEECTDESKKKVLEEVLDDDKRLSRRRSVGNIKLIAELYKLNMLNANIMFGCFQNLLKQQHEEYIECLCALLTNIGGNLTNAISKSKSNEKMNSLESIFTTLKQIHDSKTDFVVSSRIRFMILDLIDLKKNNWIPRRKADGPKTIAQVHEDMEKAERQKVIELHEMKKKKHIGPPREDDWQQVRPRKGGSTSVPKISLNHLSATLRESLSTVSNKPTIGSSSSFGSFAHGSHGGTNSNSQSRSSSSNFENKFQALSSNDKKPTNTFHDSLNANFRRDERKTSDVTNNRYQHNSRNDSPSESRNSSISSHTPSAKANIDISDEKFKAQTNELVSSCLKNSTNFQEIVSKLVGFCSKNRFNMFVCESILVALERSDIHRKSWGDILGQLFVISIYDNTEIFEGLKAAFACSEDVDLPKFWEFVGEIIASAFLQVNASESPRTAEIFKAASKAFGEVTGTGILKLTTSISETLNKADPKVAPNIIAQLQLNSQLNAKSEAPQMEMNVNNVVSKFLEECKKSNVDISTLEKELRVERFQAKFVSALFKQILNHLETLENFLYSNDDLIPLLRHYCKQSPSNELELLFACSDMCAELNNPPNFLATKFTQFLNEKLIQPQTFQTWRKSRRANILCVASTERFFKNVLEEN